jgi:tetratricopeptide (TPR) repeat protein
MKSGGGIGRGAGAAAVLVVSLATLLVSAGCAARGTRSAHAGTAPGQPDWPQPSLESQIARTRAVSAQVKPRTGVMTQTVEAWDPRLSSALLALAIGPTAERHRTVAVEYRRLGILDMAYSNFTQAVGLDPRDAAAHEGLARIWRDWGFPHLGVADALKAVRLAPTSASAANTYGTLLAAVGQLDAARTWYERALALDAGASYALNNLCYTAVMQRVEAVGVCERAVEADPTSRIGRNNLGLAYAARGDLVKARTEFAQAGPTASYYNMGMVHMGQGHYREAAADFQRASRENPHLTLAAARARQSRALLARQGEGDGDDD